jgi:AraC-like DNA-binding protein
MRRTVTYKFSSETITTDISGNISDSFGKALPFAKTQKIKFQEGIMYIQYFSHFLFYLELTTFVLHSDLKASYLIEKKRLFLIMMLEKEIFLSKEDGTPILYAENNTCYATYNRKGEFHYSVAAGRTCFCYIMPRTAWLDRAKDHYPRIEQLLNSMKNDKTLFGNLSPCRIDLNLHTLLNQLFNLSTTNPVSLEIELIKCIKAVFNQYQFLLDLKYSQRVYQIKEYIEKNYAVLHLNNKIIADIFFTTEKTLIKTFKQEFGITPHCYLMNYRMEKAKTLMISDRISPSQVYQLVGYSDFHSFRRQFKKKFGFPPSKCLCD